MVNSDQYIVGAVPTAGCHTSDDSAVATKATLVVTTTGTHGVGSFTATCAGAGDRAGNKQPAPVIAKFTVVYGFGGFRSPLPGTTVAKSVHNINVRFRLTNAAGTAIRGSVAASLAASRKVRVSLAGPNISPRTATCGWNPTAQVFGCSISIPAGVKTGNTRRYMITAEETSAPSSCPHPPAGRAVNPETIQFK